ncbi:MAG: hypothetical protein WD512_00945 [Candidatus Paceibacterota bacterium]
MHSHIYSLTSQPYYDNYNQCYRNILVLNKDPIGPLKKIVKRINPPLLSPFQEPPTACCSQERCIYAIYDKQELACVDSIPELFSYLVSNGYQIDTSVTTMMQKSPVKLNNNNLICFISYQN